MTPHNVASRALIILRQSPPWQDLDSTYLDTLESFEKRSGLPAGFIKKLVLLWNSTFKLPYFEIRYRLKQLTLENLDSIQDADWVSLDQIHNAPSGARFFLFTDDDDWYCPNTISRLQSFDRPGIGGLVWQSVKLAESLRIRLDEYCYTNNYTVTSDYLKDPAETDQLRSVLQHYDAQNAFFHKRCLTSRFVEEPLSIANKHPCSMARMFRQYRGQELTAGVLRKDVETFVSNLEGQPLPAWSQWATPYIARVRQLFGEVL